MLVDPDGLLVVMVVCGLLGFFVGWMGGLAEGRARARESAPRAFERGVDCACRRTPMGWDSGDCEPHRRALYFAVCADTGEPKDPRGCWNVRCQLGGTCCRASGNAGVGPSDDAQRLDWLQGFADVRLEAWFADGGVTRRVTRNGHTIGSGRTLREAIDAARAACPRGPADADGVRGTLQTQPESRDGEA